ncbi:unnamed protein product, partial [Onchocerca flexuosa]|uniref:Brix domain-containing protein n=1 Tax=Onchocerca flexuosa TaxID=387005 RepID=A0A183I4M0_9BILA
MNKVKKAQPGTALHIKKDPLPVQGCVTLLTFSRRLKKDLVAVVEGSSLHFCSLDDHCTENICEILTYAIVRNIPKAYHAKNLRNFFSNFVENGRFYCFHYRHRPELHVDSSVNEPTTSKEYERFCCVVSFKNDEERAACIRYYHMKFWIDDKGLQMPLKCFIFPLKASEISDDSCQMSTDLDFRFFIELKPPSLMPFGNVGTPTKFFLEQIRLCKLPPTVLTKLGIETKRRVGKYGA